MQSLREQVKRKTMTNTSKLHWDPQAARPAGALYLAIAVCGGFSIGYVPMQIMASDAATSSANLLANTAILYHMFRNVGPKMATVALISRAGMVTVMGISVLLWVMPYILLTSASDWDTTQRQALAQFCFDAHAMRVFSGSCSLGFICWHLAG